MTPTPLRTERLTLRPLAVTDVDRMLEFWNLPDVTRWLLRSSRTADELRAEVARSVADTDDHSLAVLLDDVLIGTVSLELVDGYTQPGAPSRTGATFGYTFDPAHAGHGYATEATRAALEHAFDTLGVRRVTAGAFVDNAASVRILEKLGLRREQYGVQDSWHAELGWLDGCTYALLAHERG